MAWADTLPPHLKGQASKEEEAPAPSSISKRSPKNLGQPKKRSKMEQQNLGQPNPKLDKELPIGPPPQPSVLQQLEANDLKIVLAVVQVGEVAQQIANITQLPAELVRLRLKDEQVKSAIKYVRSTEGLSMPLIKDMTLERLLQPGLSNAEFTRLAELAIKALDSDNRVTEQTNIMVYIDQRIQAADLPGLMDVLAEHDGGNPMRFLQTRDMLKEQQGWFNGSRPLKGQMVRVDKQEDEDEIEID